MSNVTSQVALNKGYTIIAEEAIAPAQSPATPLPAHAGTNRIILMAELTGGLIIRLGTIADGSAGIALNKLVNYYNGSLETQQAIPNDPLIIDTSTPEDFALYANGPGGAVNVIYLALNP